MRILFSSWPALGHLFPMLPLARAASLAGHQVVIATGAQLAGVVEREGFTHWAVGPSRFEAAARYRAEHPGEPAGATADLTHLFLPTAAPRAADLVPLAHGWRPDLVVHDVAEPAAAIAAVRTGARHVVHGNGLFAPGGWPRFAGPLAALFDRWQVPWLTETMLDATYLDVVPPSLQPGGPADFRRIQPLRPTAGPTRLGPAAPRELAGLPHQDTVYLTLGTIFNQAPEVFEAALLGLATLPVNVIVTVGHGADPDRLGPQPRNVRITDYLPQARLLPHCRLVVSHGGAGTLLGALCHGLPQLVLPRGADNFRNGAAVQAAGAGLSLPHAALTADAIADDAARLLAQPRFTLAAQRIRTEIETMPSPARVLATLLQDAPVRER